MKRSPNFLTERFLSVNGYLASQCERHLGPKHKEDVFGFVDVVAVHPPELGSLYVQATSEGGMRERFEKMLTLRIQDVAAVLIAGQRVELWAWREMGQLEDLDERSIVIEQAERKVKRAGVVVRTVPQKPLRFRFRNIRFTLEDRGRSYLIHADNLAGDVVTERTPAFKVGELGFV